jgi:hypothetical protein
LLPDITLMVKRTISICFLVLAAFVLLGHAIIPHHHHLIESAINHHDDTDSGSPANHSHEHDSGTTNHFILEQVVPVRSSEVSAIPHQLLGSHFNYKHWQLFLACLTDIQQICIQVSAFSHRSYHPISYLFYPSKDNHLRGPPSA